VHPWTTAVRRVDDSPTVRRGLTHTSTHCRTISAIAQMTSTRRPALMRGPLPQARSVAANSATAGEFRSVGIGCLACAEPSARSSVVLLLPLTPRTPRLLLASGFPRRGEQLPAPRAGPRERGTNSSEEQLDRQRTEQAADAQADRLRPSEVRHKLDARAVRPSGDRAIQQPSTLRDAVGPLKLDVDHRGGCRSRWELTQGATATFLVNNGMPLEEVKQLVCRTTVAPTRRTLGAGSTREVCLRGFDEAP